MAKKAARNRVAASVTAKRKAFRPIMFNIDGTPCTEAEHKAVDKLCERMAKRKPKFITVKQSRTAEEHADWLESLNRQTPTFLLQDDMGYIYRGYIVSVPAAMAQNGRNKAAVTAPGQQTIRRVRRLSDVPKKSRK